jgi:DNA-binding transcriptional MerR regulator
VTPETANRAKRNGGDSTASMTIDELARRTGMTVRNIRAHQSRGLVPAPEVRGRTGYYGEEHLTRIELIKELQADGFNLEAIRRLLENAGGSTAEVLRFTRTARAAFDEEEPEITTLAELAEQWGDAGSPALLERAVSLGLLRLLGDGRVEERSPRLNRAGAELSNLGIPPERALDVLESLRHHADGVARTYVDLFLERVWQPFDAAGRPADRWPEVLEALERLRPLAAESLLAMFQLAMSDHVDEAVGAQLALQSRRPPAA